MVDEKDILQRVKQAVEDWFGARMILDSYPITQEQAMDQLAAWYVKQSAFAGCSGEIWGASAVSSSKCFRFILVLRHKDGRTLDVVLDTEPYGRIRITSESTVR